jgi:hypothetical protein
LLGGALGGLKGEKLQVGVVVDIDIGRRLSLAACGRLQCCGYRDRIRRLGGAARV